MKKEYTAPKFEAVKITSEEPSAAFANGNFNSANIPASPKSDAVNIVNY